MKRIVTIITTLAATFAVADQVAHAAAPIRECQAYNMGGGFVNLTTRNVSCKTAPKVAISIQAHMPKGCYDNLHKPPCYFRIRGQGAVWSGHPRWFHDRFGRDQLDVRATTSRGRVGHFQTDWDGE